ncbi:MAG: hypothetical protein LUH55_00795 [Bacteroides thetaiotaomicron]|nr:hypothetical protein [Bacteroides thetaiotaomicron]
MKSRRLTILMAPSISNIIEQAITFTQRHADYLFTRPDYSKILLSFIEMNLSGLLRLCVAGVRQNRFEISETGQINTFYDKMKKLHDICIAFFSLKVLPDDKQFVSEITIALNDIVLIADIYTKYFYNNTYIVELPYRPDLFESPRFEQLSWFRRNCILLSEQCCSGYVKSDIDRSYQAARLQTSLRYTYGKLAFVPLNILNDYYYSLIAYMLALAPQDHAKLYSYIYNDLKRYEHIWKRSQELLLLKEMMMHFISDTSKSE